MLKVGVIGAGNLGETHIKLLKGINDFELVGFYDGDESLKKNVSQSLNTKSFNNVNELIDLVDVVDIVKPTISHFDYAVNAIKQSKHVFIEKPVTTTVDEAKQLLELAEEANVKVQVGHVERFNPAFKAALPYITNPMFIETHRMIKFDPKKANIQVVMDLMSHDLDIILSVANSNIKKISAKGVEVIGSTPDIVNAIIEFDNGCVANLTASRISLKDERISKFYQKDAHIKIDYLAQETSLFSLKKNGKIEICSKQLTIKKENPIQRELEEFAHAIINNTTPEVGIHDGSVMLDAAYRVAEKMQITSSLI
ncbi:MAG: Gfo/Idh/MocA family oxidoreductase [Flavobacteriales bacterium]|nr:Gfo/Idh/MocA family oxidoreductase [Flavobacteriales bacterium]